MEARQFNTGVEITLAEKDEMAKKLIAAGVDRKIVDAALRPTNAVAEGSTCCHRSGTCNQYYKMSPDAMKALTDEIKKKGINTQALGGAVAKYLK